MTRSEQRLVFGCLVAASLSTFSATPLSAEEAPRELFFRIVGEFAAQDLGDLNDTIRAGQNLVPRDSVYPDERTGRETFGPTFAWGADAGTYLAPRWRFGAAGRRQTSSVTNSRRLTDPGTPGGGAEVTDEIELKLMEISAFVEFWPTDTAGLHFGVHAGAGFGTAKGTYSRRDFTDSSNDLRLDTKADGHGLTWGVYFASRPKKRLFTRVGYRFRDLGSFDGKTTSPQFGAGAQPPQAEDGRPLRFDFSGFYFAVGFEFRRELEPPEREIVMDTMASISASPYPSR